MTIVIDPGHGLNDAGAVAGGVREKQLALTYGLTLGGELCRLGVPVIYTRTGDTYPTLGERVLMANERSVDGFVSVHFNASINPNASGIWLLHCAVSEKGKVFAETIQKETGGKVLPDASPHVNGRKLAVLWRTKMPAVLMEYGFLTNDEDRERVQHVEHMRDLVAKTAAGITAWLRTAAVTAIALLALAAPASAQVDTTQLRILTDSLRIELVRSRGFVRAAETQLTKTLLLTDRVTALLAAPSNDSVRIAFMTAPGWNGLAWDSLTIQEGDSVQACAYEYRGGVIVTKSDAACPDPPAPGSGVLPAAGVMLAVLGVVVLSRRA